MVTDLYGAGSLSACLVMARKTAQVEETGISVTFICTLQFYLLWLFLTFKINHLKYILVLVELLN